MSNNNMTISTGNFAVYNGRAVAVKSIDGSTARISYIQRNIDQKRIDEVDLFDLEELTEKLANKMISEYNMRVHSFHECLRYM